MAAGPAQKRLRYLPWNRWQWIRLPVSLQTHQGEEIPAPRLQGKTEGKQNKILSSRLNMHKQEVALKMLWLKLLWIHA